MINVSVILPVYNNANSLFASLNSLIHQTLECIEIICINDGSTDLSGKILYGFSNKDNRIKIVNQENRGPGGARNTGIRHAKGNYIAFLDSDDTADIGFLEILYQKAITTEADIVVCDAKNIEEGVITLRYQIGILIKKIGKDVLNTNTEKKRIINNAVPWNKLYKRKFLLSNEIYFPENCWFEDNVFNWKAIVLANRVALIEEPLVEYNVASGKTKNYFDFFKMINLIENVLHECDSYAEFGSVLYKRKFQDSLRLYYKVPIEQREGFLDKISEILNERMALDLFSFTDKLFLLILKKKMAMALSFFSLWFKYRK